MNDLKFLIIRQSILKIRKSLEKIRKIVLDWVTDHAVTYDINNTEAILFSKARNPKLRKQISDIPLQLGNHTIFFNKEVTRWLGIWFDS